MERKKFIECKHGYDNENSKLDFFTNYRYPEDVNKKLKEFEINKFDEKTNILLKLALIVFMDMYKDKDFILESLDKTNIEFIDGNIEINKNNIMGYYRPLVFENPFIDHNIKNKKTQIKLANKINNRMIPDIEQYLNLIHELRHHIVSLKNNYYIQENIFYTRIGIAEHIIREDNLKLCYTFNVLLDEAYNQYIAEVLINNVLSMKHCYIDDEKIKEVLFDLRNPEESGYYKNYSYYESIKLLHPILSNEKFTKIMNELTYLGEMDQLKILFNDVFDEVIDIYSFGHEFQKALLSQENYDNMKQKIKTMERCLNNTKIL